MTTTREVIPLDVRLACARREVAFRHKVYPGLVQKERMTESQAQAEIAAMQSLVRTCKVLVEVAPEVQDVASELRAGRFVGKSRLLALMTRLEAMIGTTQDDHKEA